MILKQVLKRCYRRIKCKKGVFKSDLNLEKVYLIGTEDFGNLGDHQIAASEVEYLSRYFDNVVEITASEFYRKKDRLIAEITDNNIIFLQGGGNIGNQYPYSANIRRDIILTWPKNIKVVFPQTFFYTNDSEGRKELVKDRFFLNKANNIIAIARENESFDFVCKNFNCKSLLTPDIVLSSAKDIKVEREDKVLTLLRKDVERKLTQEDEDEINSALSKHFEKIISDDTQKAYDISKESRSRELASIFNSIASSKLVITDRLHGMVFAAITATPCIVFQNYNHKVLGTYRWISYLPYVHLVNDVDEMKKVLDTEFYKESYCYDDRLSELFDGIINEVREEYFKVARSR